MSDVIVFSGGDLGTNAYLIPCSDGSYLCVDAPPELDMYLELERVHISALLLTHGHYDHVWDAAKVQKRFNCPVYLHPLDHAMVTNPSYLAGFGVDGTYPVPEKIDSLDVPNKGSMPWKCQGLDFTLLHVPGHCPGSIAFYLPNRSMIWGGDVLFATGVGRWDLPGGSRADLLFSIQSKFLTLPDEVIVYPGHGPKTTIGEERRSNPYVG